MNDGHRIFLDYCVGNLELIVIIKLFLDNQKGSFDITHWQNKLINHGSHTNPEFNVLNFDSNK